MQTTNIRILAWAALLMSCCANAATVTFPNNGGTGKSNSNASTITISGAYPITFNLSNSTNLTLPTSGTLLYSGGPGDASNFTGTATGLTCANVTGTGAATVASLTATGVVDGKSNVIVTTSNSNAVESPEKFNVYNLNNYATDAGAVTYTLPVAAAGKVRCYRNYINKSGVITIATSGSGQYIDVNGTLGASGGSVATSGALGDAACFLGVDSTHWEEIVVSGGGFNPGTPYSWTAVQTYTNSDIRLLGSSTGYTTFTSANAGASNYVLTIPALTGTVVTTGDTGTVTSAMLAGSIATSKLATVQGNGTKVQLSTGTTTTNDCVKFDANGNTVDAGSACGSGGGGNDPRIASFPVTPAVAPTAAGTTAAAQIAIGDGAVVAGNNSNTMAIGQCYSSAANATCINVGNSTSSYGAKAQGAFVAGYQSIGTGAECISAGYGDTCGGLYSSSIGGSNSTAQAYDTSVGSYNATNAGAGTAVGYSNTNSFARASVIGAQGQTDFSGEVTFSSGYSASQGDVKVSLFPLWTYSTNATPIELGMAAGGTTVPNNYIALTNNSMYMFDCDIIARQSTTGTSYSAWQILFAINREANAASTALVGTVTKNIIGQSGTTTGWDVAATADTTNGRPAIKVTGAASTNIKWSASCRMTKVSG